MKTNFLLSFGDSRILESTGIKWGIGFKCDRLLWINTFAVLGLGNGACHCHCLLSGIKVNAIFSLYLYFKGWVRISYFFVLIVGISHFCMLGKNFPQSHLIIVIRECPQNDSTHILRYFNNFSMIPFI